MKNVLIWLAILILAVPFALGVALSPVEIYESVEAEFSIEVDNYLGHDVITQITLDSPDLEIIDVLDFLGWSGDFSSSQITWSDGSIETNVKQALFMYNAKAGLVSADETKSFAGTLYYDDTTTEDFSINITVKNDSTLPVLNDIFPADGGYALAHNPSQEIRINASDPETGIKSVTYEFSDCSGNASSAVLACTDDYCTGTGDFSGYGESDTACFTAAITNNAEETTIITGSFGFDETPPSVELVSPINDDFSNQMFRFNVSDNKADEFECSVEIDGNEVQQLDAYTGVNAFALTANITEGSHDWKVICADAVGLEGEDSDSFIYDITPPVITLNSPEQGSAIKDITIDISVADNFEVDSVENNLDFDSSSWPDGWNTLTVTAADKAGNTAEESFDFYVDRSAPEIEIISPNEGDTIDYHGDFVIIATDDFDEAIECAVSTSVADPVTEDVASGVQSTISVLLPLGDFTWYMLCVDDVGNSVQSAERNATSADLTGPDIVISDIKYVARGTDLEVQATVTDISSVKQVYADFEGNTFNLASLGNDVYAGSIAVPADKAVGDYIVTVYAVDNNDMTNSEVDYFEIVENYAVTINMPESVGPGESVAVSGSVVKDDSSAVEGTVTITYSDGATDVALNANGEFSYSFTAPSSDGTYDITVAYETDVLVYSKTRSFSVVTPSQQSSGSGSTGIPFDYQGGYSGIKPKEETPEPEPSGEGSASELIQPEEPEEELTEEIPEEEPRVPGITGSVAGIFSNTGWTWLIVLFGAIALVIGSVYSIRTFRKKKDDIDWGPKFR